MCRLFDFLIAFSIARKAYIFFLFPVSLDASFVTIIFTMFIFASMKNHHQHPNTHLDKNEKSKIFSEYYNKLVAVYFRDGNNTFFVWILDSFWVWKRYFVHFRRAAVALFYNLFFEFLRKIFLHFWQEATAQLYGWLSNFCCGKVF